MPIYEYKCHVCGHQEDILQKMSDEPLVNCPKCGKQTFNKLISMPAGFDLKGNGWYVTDFKNKSPTSSATTSENKTSGCGQAACGTGTSGTCTS